VLFVDEPTSGLSSHDSEKVMHLLRKHALSGKLVIANIHQPSSDIFKLFDRLWIIDRGGYMIYDGDPVEALVYFKTETSQANAAESECPNCGNIETDNILNIVEVKVIDNEGYSGSERQVVPREWYEKYRKKMMPVLSGQPEKKDLPESNFKVPGLSSQIRTFVKRTLTRKLADRQYMVINLLEAPLLAFALGYLSKFTIDGQYFFSENKSYPVFLFMSVVVALFLGLMVSAEEIFRDRKILEREKFLNYSRGSYLISKISFLFALSAIQTLLFLVVASLILEIRGMFWLQWIILFSTACYGNLIGLNISSGMRTIVSIYILIPLILVPQILLGGAMIRFDDLHKSLTHKEYVPVIGDLMGTRWAYEAIMVEGFKDNKYNKSTFLDELEIEQNNYYKDKLIVNLNNDLISYVLQKDTIKSEQENIAKKLRILDYHVNDLADITGIAPGSWENSIREGAFNDRIADSVKTYFEKVKKYFIARNAYYYQDKSQKEEQLWNSLNERERQRLSTAYNNKWLEDIVLNQGDITESSYYELKNKWVQRSTPIFMKPTSRIGRSHFYAPYKQVGDIKIDTLVFNLAAIWIMTFLYSVALYFSLLKRLINYLESLRLPFWRKFGRLGLLMGT